MDLLFVGKYSEQNIMFNLLKDELSVDIISSESELIDYLKDQYGIEECDIELSDTIYRLYKTGIKELKCGDKIFIGSIDSDVLVEVITDNMNCKII